MKKRPGPTTNYNFTSIAEYRQHIRTTQLDFLTASIHNMLPDEDDLSASPVSSPSLPEQYEEFLRRHWKGKEKTVLCNFPVDLPKEPNPHWLPNEPFRLMDLPAELRVYIYQSLLPHNMIITFERIGVAPYGQQWIVTGKPKTGDSPVYEIVPAPPHSNQRFRLVHPKYPDVETQLFVVCKPISNEARAVLYASNTFKFTIDGRSHHPSSLRSPEIFGSFGANNRLPLLRNLRSIHIDVLLDHNTHWTVKRQRSRLEYFVEVLKEFADDDNRKSLLEELKVEVRLGSKLPYSTWVPFNLQYQPPEDSEKFMFGLESLAALTGIKDVEVVGLPKWFAKSLQVRINGTGGEIEMLDWPMVEVKRRKGAWGTSKKRGWVSTRKWYQPTLNWKEFAQRNHIAVPADIDKYLVAEE